MSKVTEISDKFFTGKDNGMSLTEFARSITTTVTSPDYTVSPTTEQDFVVNGTNVYQFLTDTGGGRIFDGLKSLELMSRIIRGVGQSSATLFDNVIIAFTADDMKGAPINVAVDIVTANLGLRDVLSYTKRLNLTEATKYEDFATRLAREVRAGSFRTEDYIMEALVRVKALVKIAMNTNKVVR